MAATQYYNPNFPFPSRQSPSTPRSATRYSFQSTSSSASSSSSHSRNMSVSSHLSDGDDSAKQVFMVHTAGSSWATSPPTPAPWQRTFYNSLNEKPLPPLPKEGGQSTSGSVRSIGIQRGGVKARCDKKLPMMPINKLEYETMMHEGDAELEMEPPVLVELSASNDGAWWI